MSQKFREINLFHTYVRMYCILLNHATVPVSTKYFSSESNFLIFPHRVNSTKIFPCVSGLYPFANVLNLAMMFSFLLLALWSYIKYTGNFSEIGATIDEMSVTVWDSAIQPTFAKVAEESANYAARQAVSRLNSTSSNPPMSVKKRQ